MEVAHYEIASSPNGLLAMTLVDKKKKHGAEVHRGVKDTEKTVSGQQAHSEKVLICACGQQRSIETWNALLSLEFPTKAVYIRK